MYEALVRSRALQLLRDSGNLSAVSQATGVARSTIRSWAAAPAKPPADCTGRGRGPEQLEALACLFPQHGPGRKHERAIVLEEWQGEVVRAFPADFLRGLFHSDGCRVDNWATRMVRGEKKRYDYPRWQFVNASEDILGLCPWALDLVDVPWRRSGARVVSVSRREAVARLDELIGPKA